MNMYSQDTHMEKNVKDGRQHVRWNSHFLSLFESAIYMYLLNKSEYNFENASKLSLSNREVKIDTKAGANKWFNIVCSSCTKKPYVMIIYSRPAVPKSHQHTLNIIN